MPDCTPSCCKGHSDTDEPYGSANLERDRQQQRLLQPQQQQQQQQQRAESAAGTALTAIGRGALHRGLEHADSGFGTSVDRDSSVDAESEASNRPIVPKLSISRVDGDGANESLLSTDRFASAHESTVRTPFQTARESLGDTQRTAITSTTNSSSTADGDASLYSPSEAYAPYCVVNRPEHLRSPPPQLTFTATFDAEKTEKQTTARREKPQSDRPPKEYLQEMYYCAPDSMRKISEVTEPPSSETSSQKSRPPSA